ncbi:MAG: D-glycero-beta-D-manno-heptose 1,7-bisphosphate 7-phosphatase [bacterium]
MQRAAVFLDRDGTLNEEVGYLSHPEDLVLIPGSGDAVRRINQSGMAAVVVSNQSGLARGYFDEAALSLIHDRLRGELAKFGASLDGIFFCPHHPEGEVEEYRIECACRKPWTGLMDQAVFDLDINLAASYMVGDHIKDIQMAARAGIRSVMVLTGHGQEEWDKADEAGRSLPTHVAPDLAAAVDWILRDREHY